MGRKRTKRGDDHRVIFIRRTENDITFEVEVDVGARYRLDLKIVG